MGTEEVLLLGLAVAGLIKAWLFPGSPVSAYREYLVSGRFGQLSQLVACSVCLSYWVALFLVVFYWLPLFWGMSEIWRLLWRAPVYVLAVAQVAQLVYTASQQYGLLDNHRS